MLDNIRSFDLYRHLRPVKTLLQLENLKLATLESYLNISRLDQATGKEMIAGYSLSTASSSLTIVVDCSVKVPVAVTRELPLCRLSIRANQIIIEIRAFVGELKYFFDNYKDYYYLPAEDTAMHKSVASYVDKEHRRQATAATCYTRHEGPRCS